VLVYISLVAAVVSSLGAPLIPSISQELHVSLSTAQWSLTVALLSGAVSGPIMGRLGDGPHRRATLVVGVSAVTLGGMIAALAPNMAVLIVGRMLQGVALGLVPVTMATARDHLPRDRVPSMIALLSVSAAAGVGVGYPLSGVIADRLGLSAAFWFGVGVSGVALLCLVAVVPSSRDRPAATLDVRGTLALTLGLIALLLAIAEGNRWGWSSMTLLSLIAAAIVLLGAWVPLQLRAHAPLVDLRLFRHPAVLKADLCAFALGVAMYLFLSALTDFVQTPTAAGYGFSASVVVAGLCLVPLSILSVALSRAIPNLTRLLGDRGVLAIGSVIVAGGGVFFAVFNNALWQAFVMMSLIGCGLGLTFAAIPGLIVGSVPAGETGSALGFYQVVRYVGFSIGSALTASILSSRTPAGAHLPSRTGFVIAFGVGAAMALVAGTVAWVLPDRSRVRTQAVTDRFVEEDTELATAGLVGLTQDYESEPGSSFP
jgi:MFS family permease